jgi:hypothetical protein
LTDSATVLSAWLRPAVATLVVAAAGLLGAVTAAPPAVAAPCPGTAGVTVVIEYGALGGGVDQLCAPEGGGRTAGQLLQDTGHALTWVQRFPGFVCRIEGLPADDPCVNTPPADAYWGLWWSDGKSGEWSYSSLGAGSLTIPAGGYVAMVWDDSSGDVRPRTGAPAHPNPTPTPTKKPSPSQAPTTIPAPTTPATPTATVSGTTTPEPTARPSRTKKPSPSKTSTKTPSPSEETTAPDPSEEPSSDDRTDAAGPIDQPVTPAASSDGGGLPVWVAPVVVVVLLGTAAGVALARRRQQP